MPAMNRRLRPSRSPARPPSSRNPPKISVYALTTHCRLEGEKCRPRWIEGSATLTTVASSTTMNCARQAITRISQRFEAWSRAARGGAGAGRSAWPSTSVAPGVCAEAGLGSAPVGAVLADVVSVIGGLPVGANLDSAVRLGYHKRTGGPVAILWWSGRRGSGGPASCDRDPQHRWRRSYTGPTFG